jgi:hypothetical protein
MVLDDESGIVAQALNDDESGIVAKALTTS